jgi:hypothetical protein
MYITVQKPSLATLTDFSQRDEAAAFQRCFTMSQSNEGLNAIETASGCASSLHLRGQDTGGDNESREDGNEERAVGARNEDNGKMPFNSYLSNISELANDGCGLGDDCRKWGQLGRTRT